MNALPRLTLSADRRYLLTEHNEPFFWLGDTAWELIHRLSREEVDYYLRDRAQKGFTVIQTVILAELDGLHTPNVYGETPLIADDPTRLNEAYFEHVDYVLHRAEDLGLYIGLLPAWGDKFSLLWGEGPVVFTPATAAAYARLLAYRYRRQRNIVWILGGDRVPENDSHAAIIRAMANGLREIDREHLISYHPTGRAIATDYVNEPWLDIDMFQSGHDRSTLEYRYVAKGLRAEPPRPVVNGESRYENIPDRFWEKNEWHWLDDADVRVSAYWSLLAGAAGYTYGCNDVWQMYALDKKPVIHARTGWTAGLALPGSTQMSYLKRLLTSFPWQEMKNNQSLIVSENREDSGYVMAALGNRRDFLIVYTPEGRPFTLDLSALRGSEAAASWFNPRSGQSITLDTFSLSEKPEFIPWARGRGSDFALVVVADTAGRKIP